ncbi:MarR family transcriptional regulator, partial [Streptomyces violaceoruber]
SHQLTRMSKRELVTRRRANGVIVALTDAGHQAITAVYPGLDAAVRRHFTDKLSTQEVETLAAVLGRL